VSEYNTERNYYQSLVDSYNNNYVGQNLTIAQYQESVSAKNIIDAELPKQDQLKAELDILSTSLQI